MYKIIQIENLLLLTHMDFQLPLNCEELNL